MTWAQKKHSSLNMHHLHGMHYAYCIISRQTILGKLISSWKHSFEKVLFEIQMSVVEMKTSKIEVCNFSIEPREVKISRDYLGSLPQFSLMDFACIELHKQKVNACIKVTKIQSVISFSSFYQKRELRCSVQQFQRKFTL